MQFNTPTESTRKGSLTLTLTLDFSCGRERMEEQNSMPSSPGTKAVEPKDCIEELVRFAFQSHITQTLGFDLGLSSHFCSTLLNHDPLVPVPNDSVSHSLGQSPPSPLYKRLALTLYEWITSGTLHETSGPAVALCEDSGPKERGEWSELVLNEGTRLLNILKTINFELHVQEPFFSQLKDGLKTVEGRCAVGDYNRIGPGALILFNKCLVLQVQAVHRYGSFAEMLEAESLAKVLPGVKTIDEGVKVYRKFYREEKEKSNGVLGICVGKSAAQPYIPLARILSGLTSKGIGNIMGVPHISQ